MFDNIGWPELLVLALVAWGLSNVISNSATANLLIPIALPLAASSNLCCGFGNDMLVEWRRIVPLPRKYDCYVLLLGVS